MTRMKHREISEIDYLHRLMDRVSDGTVRLTVNDRIIGTQRIRSRIRYTDRVWPKHILQLVHGGMIERTVNGRNIVSRAGSFFWLFPGVKHDFIFHPGTVHTVIQFTLAGKTGPEPECGFFAVENAGAVSWLFDRLQHEMQLKERSAAAVRSYLALLFLELSRIIRKPQQHAFNPAAERKIRDTIRDNVHRHPTSADLARALGLSQDYFTRVFRRTYAVSPRTHILREVMRSASFDLSGGNAVGDIAERYGYDIAAFSRLFRKVTGQSPAVFRRGHGITDNG
ncbi:MAG: helix-turn-helix transcriptional regulator [Spirochaetes bacterium]|nr:helix-turn-helix transcriptional regulator [Spirochaetota bacterium]